MTTRTEVYRIPRVREDGYIQSNLPILVEGGGGEGWMTRTEGYRIPRVREDGYILSNSPKMGG